MDYEAKWHALFADRDGAQVVSDPVTGIRYDANAKARVREVGVINVTFAETFDKMRIDTAEGEVHDALSDKSLMGQYGNSLTKGEIQRIFNGNGGIGSLLTQGPPTGRVSSSWL